MAHASSMTIGDLAAATDTRVETVRWYEKVKLLPAPARSLGNYRLYGPEHPSEHDAGSAAGRAGRTERGEEA